MFLPRASTWLYFASSLCRSRRRMIWGIFCRSPKFYHSQSKFRAVFDLCVSQLHAFVAIFSPCTFAFPQKHDRIQHLAVMLILLLKYGVSYLLFKSYDSFVNNAPSPALAKARLYRTIYFVEIVKNVSQFRNIWVPLLKNCKENISVQTSPRG